jgi:hypothetical protein
MDTGLVPVPPILHFIWAGGTTPMPPAGVANVQDWLRANPTFTARIWVDAATDPGAAARYPGLTVVDITDGGVVTPEVRYELDSLWPNYGASSDLLRYAILERVGGFYIDCLDVFPLPGSPGLAAHPGLTDGFALHATPHTLAPDRPGAGTEAIVCSPDHPLMRDLAARARAAYHGRAWTHRALVYHVDPPPPRIAGPFGRWGDAPSVDFPAVVGRRARDTLALTGPGLAIDVLGPALRAHTTDGWARFAGDHSLNWAKAKVSPRAYAAALSATVGSILFEARNMSLFNPALHVEHTIWSVLLAEGGEVPTLRARIRADLFNHLRDHALFRIDPTRAGADDPLRQLVIR